VLDRANQALQTLERYKTRLDDITASFAALEIEDLVTLRDVATVLQRSEMVNRISDEIDMMIVELGVDARLLRLQLEELSGATDVDLDLVIRDYLPAGDTRKAVDVMHELQILPDEELLDLRVVAATFLPETPGLELDHGLQPRGYRLLAKVPRLTSEQAEGVVARFGSLATLMRAAVADLADVPGIDVARAEAIKDSLARLAESSILDQYM
jgi:diadenylate cyclase